MVRLVNKIRKLFTKKSADSLSFSSEEFIKSLHLIVGLDQLLENLSAKLREILDSGSVYIVLFEPITNRYVGKKAKGDRAEWLSMFNFSQSDHLIRWLNVNQCPLDMPRAKGVVEFLSEREREVLQRTDTILVAPLIVLNRLTGVVFISRKLNGEVYNESEINLLSMLVNQSALALEYAVMSQFQEDRLKKLFHADKLATIGKLAAGVAHEIRNPLAAIRSTVQYVRKDLFGDKKSFIDGVIEEVDRINQIIEGLLSFSRVSELQIANISVEELLDQTLLLLDPELRQHEITAQRHSNLTDSNIPADASQLKQVFLNILLNSIQSMPNGGTITITTTDATGEERPLYKSEFVCVTIKDTGSGIPEYDLPRVFDPFFTTKETGTGLGLSISYGIISKHGGEIDIESTTECPDAGTTVRIRVPKIRGGYDEERTER